VDLSPADYVAIGPAGVRAAAVPLALTALVLTRRYAVALADARSASRTSCGWSSTPPRSGGGQRGCSGTRWSLRAGCARTTSGGQVPRGLWPDDSRSLIAASSGAVIAVP